MWMSRISSTSNCRWICTHLSPIFLLTSLWLYLQHRVSKGATCKVDAVSMSTRGTLHALSRSWLVLVLMLVTSPSIFEPKWMQVAKLPLLLMLSLLLLPPELLATCLLTCSIKVTNKKNQRIKVRATHPCHRQRCSQPRGTALRRHLSWKD